MKWDFRGRAVIQQILPHFKRASSVERTWALSGSTEYRVHTCREEQGFHSTKSNLRQSIKDGLAIQYSCKTNLVEFCR